MDGALKPGRDCPARILVGDGDGLFRTSLRHLLEAPVPVLAEVYQVDVGAGYLVVGEAATAEEVVALARRTTAELLLVDLHWPDRSGLSTLAELSSSAAHLRTMLMYGDVTRSELAEAIRIGVRGLVPKNAAPDALLGAIQSVLDGRSWLDHSLVTDFLETARPLLQSARSAGCSAALRLTRREREVLGFVVAGYANKDIALASSVTEDSIKHHLTRIYEKLGVSNRVALATLATERGLLDA
jgi:DNA-binding NarL/FixJ family response regulator